MVLDAHAIEPRQPVHAFDDLGRHVADCEHGTATLAARAAKALVERVDADFGELARAVVAGGGKILPIVGMRDVSLLALAGARVEEAGRRPVGAQGKTALGHPRKKRHPFLLPYSLA